MSPFNAELAFSRSQGWLTDRELRLLRTKRVAIAGMGGVGGIHLLTLARLGVGAFHIADFDQFSLENFNRQVGANINTLGRSKVDVMAEQALEINPDLKIEKFDRGVRADNVDAFLAGVDLYVDGLDFFAFDARELVFAKCSELQVPATTVAPIGMGAALLNFLPGRMTFEQYFRWKGASRLEKALRFYLGLCPAGLQRPSLVDPTTLDLATGKGPSTPMGVSLAAGVMGSEAVKILCQRGPTTCAPHGLHFDAYSGRVAKTWLPGGNAHPLQQLRLWMARRQFRGAEVSAEPKEISGGISTNS